MKPGRTFGLQIERDPKRGDLSEERIMAASAKMTLATSAKNVLDHFSSGEPVSESVLSVYLDTTAMRVIDRAYLSSFKACARELRSAITLKDTANLEAAESAITIVETFLSEKFAPEGPGIAIFAGKDRVLQVAALPFRPEDEVHWAPRPVVEPLRRALDDFERIGVVLIDSEQTRFLSIFLGQIDHQITFTDDVPGKQATGGWYGLSQKRYQRHHDDRVLKHIKRTVGMLGEELTERPFDRLFVGGPDEAVSLFRHHLPRRIEQRLAGEISVELFAADDVVLQAALKSGHEAELKQEVEEISALLENRTDRVVIGPENTFHALHLGRVDRLYVAKLDNPAGSRCLECGRLTRLDPCPECTGQTEPVADIAEVAIERAADQGARIEFVSGAAAQKLLTAGGIAGWTRHSER
jgi:hypothetical protein